MEEKKCAMCREFKPIEQFYKFGDESRGIRKLCKGCATIKNGLTHEERMRRKLDQPHLKLDSWLYRPVS